jgi:hypothetical protein
MAGFMPAPAYAKNVSYKDAVEGIADSIEAAITSSDRVAIDRFQSVTPQFTKTVIDDLDRELKKRKITVVNRQDRETFRAEQMYSSSDYVDDDSQVRVGHEEGASASITGTGENMTEYYRLVFRMISLEKNTVLMQTSVNVQYDATMRRLLNDQAYNAGEIGSVDVLIGARLGAGFEINTADDGDAVQTGISPREKSNIAFNATLFGAFRFNDSWAVQPELIFMSNNGMELGGNGNTVAIDYPTLDIPLLLRWTFIVRPVLAGIVLGPYISFPVGRLNLSVGGQGAALDTTGYTFGATGGFVIGIKAGAGYLTGDVRFLHDFSSLEVREDFGDGIEDANILLRRSINLTIGYEFSL